MLLVGLTCIVLLVFTTIIHYEVLRTLTTGLSGFGIPARAKLIVVILGTISNFIPVPHDALEYLHRMVDAVQRAPLIGLVRHLGLPGSDDDGGYRSSVTALQVGAIGGKHDGFR